MATLYITEYPNVGYFNGNPIGGAPLEPPVANQTITLGASSTQSATLNPSTQYVRLSTDTIAGIQIGNNPTAGASSRRMPANTFQDVSIPLSSGFKVAAITP